MTTTEPITTAQAEYLIGLRDQIVTIDRFFERDASGEFRVPMYLSRLCRIIARDAKGYGMAKALRLAKCQWLPAQDGDTAEDIKAHLLAVRARIVALTDDTVAALDKTTASSLINAAKRLCG